MNFKTSVRCRIEAERRADVNTMQTKIYRFPKQRSSPHASEARGAADEAIARDLHTLAETERRRAVIRTCRMIGSRERRRRGRSDER